MTRGNENQLSSHPHPPVSGIVNERLVLLDKCDKFEETFHIAHFKIPSEVEYR